MKIFTEVNLCKNDFQFFSSFIRIIWYTFSYMSLNCFISSLTNILYFLIFIDDSISAASTSDVQDRLSALELRVQQQEDEITVLKAALADVLRRLAISEDHVASVKKSVPSKGNLSVL